MNDSSTNEDEVAQWKGAFVNDDQQKGFDRVVEWARGRKLMESIAGDSYIIAFPHLPSSSGWLIVSLLEGAVLVSFAKLKGYAPFVGDGRSRLMKRMRRGGFLQEDGSHQFARVDLADLKDDFEWSLLKSRLDPIADFAGTPAEAAG
jgi:hypothetical protein